MTDVNHIEIYKQRYETFRHFDRLKWQMFQIAITVGPITLAVAEKYNRLSWGLIAVGVVWVVLGFVMKKIQKGILMNRETLRMSAEVIGDQGIPTNKHKRSMISEWVSTLLILAGFIVFPLAFALSC